MTGITTQMFRFATDAGSHDVWAALTRPDLTPRYLYGLAARSEWRPGATVTFTGEAATLTGEVLAAEEPRRLSYSLRAAGEGQPETYVTWEIVDAEPPAPGRSGLGGTVVRLYVDEPDGDAGAEAAWLRVMARLESVLAGAEACDPRV